MLFLVDGVITMGFGIIGYFAMTNSAETAKVRLRCDRPSDRAVAQPRGEGPARRAHQVGQRRHDRDRRRDPLAELLAGHLYVDALWRCAHSPVHIQAWLCGFMFLLNNIVVQGIAVFLCATRPSRPPADVPQSHDHHCATPLRYRLDLIDAGHLPDGFCP